MQEYRKTLLFVFVLCLAASIILTCVSLLLKPYQERSALIDQSKQLLIAAKILNSEGYFLIETAPLVFQEGKKASDAEILTVYQTRILPRLTNSQGDVFTFEEAGLSFSSYIEAHQKKGYAHLEKKLIYFVLENGSSAIIRYVIPINGYGLWDAIYGYLALSKNGETVIGTTWYQQKETAGLGANISLPSWQKQFLGKSIVPPGETLQTGYLGINVIKGSSSKSINSVDGITGATLTSQGVTSAYHDSLTPYRPFLLRAHNEK